MDIIFSLIDLVQALGLFIVLMVGCALAMYINHTKTM